MENKLSSDMLESIIIKGILNKKEFLTMLMGPFESKYFDNPVYKDIFECVIDHYKEHLTIPNEFIIKDIIGDDTIFNKINDLDFNIDKEYDFLIKETNNYLKEKAVKQSIMDSVDIVDSGKNINEIKEIVENALSKDLILDLGLNYWNTLGDRLKQILKFDELKVPLYYPMLDEFINGGVIPYSLSIFLSRIHGFKCVGADTIITIRDKKTKEIYDTRIEDFFLFFKKQKKREFMLTLNGMIKRCGKEEGTKKYNKWKKNVAITSKNRNTLPYFIKKYGKVEGTKRRDVYIQKQKEYNIYKNRDIKHL